MVSAEYKADSFSYISLCCLFIFASRPENGNTSQTSCRKHTTSQANSRSDKEREQWTMMAMLCLFNGQLMKYSVVKTAHGHGKQRTHQRRKKPSLWSKLPVEVEISRSRRVMTSRLRPGGTWVQLDLFPNPKKLRGESLKCLFRNIILVKLHHDEKCEWKSTSNRLNVLFKHICQHHKRMTFKSRKGGENRPCLW